MDQPTHPVLQQIRDLDPSSADFHHQLDNILHGLEYEKCVESLEGDDLVWFVEYLDKVLDSLGNDPDIGSRKCMRELGRLCRDKAIFPRSYTISPTDLRVDEFPFTTGGFGDVYHGTYNGIRVCVKRLRLYKNDASGTVNEFRREAVMWKYLKHPNVLPFLGATISPPQLVSVLIPGGNLSEYLSTHPNADLLKLLSEIAEGLSYLHSRTVIHGDLKAMNVLVDVVDNVPRACIADLGTAIVTRNLNSMRAATVQGSKTPRWSAPEVLKEQNPTMKSDVYSFAMIVVEVFTGEPPYNNVSEWMVPLGILSGKRPAKPEHQAFTEPLWALIQSCWVENPDARPDISKVSQTLRSLVPQN